MFTMKQATVADAAAVLALTRESYQKWVAVTGREPLPMRVDYAEALLKSRIDLLYEGDEFAEGKQLAALIETQLEPDHLLIVNVAVSPTFQKRGLGRRLMAHAETLAAEAGRAKLLLYTNSLMGENISLYQKLGYRIEREQQFVTSVQVYMSKSTPQNSG
jgi:ribosomal protein S18 acetylase RimI-like enzyme